jgi:hypothetical protein
MQRLTSASDRSPCYPQPDHACGAVAGTKGRQKTGSSSMLQVFEHLSLCYSVFTVQQLTFSHPARDAVGLLHPEH